MLKRRKRTSAPRFRRPRRASNRMLTWWVLWRVPALLGIVMAAWWFGVRPIMHEQGWVRVTQDFGVCGDRSTSRQQCVVDGDTVIIGSGRDQRRIRLTGFDAPELDGACEAERQLAASARDALHEWLSKSAFEWNGADSPPRDKYGRELRAVRRIEAGNRKEYLADTMISRGLASESGWGVEPKDWCATE